MGSVKEIDSGIKWRSKMKEIRKGMKMVSSWKLGRGEKNSKWFRGYMEKMEDGIRGVVGWNSSSNDGMFKCRDIKRSG